MAITRTKTTDSQFTFGPGIALTATGFKKAIEHLNYVMGELSETLFSGSIAWSQQFDEADNTLQITQFRINVPSDVTQVRLAARLMDEHDHRDILGAGETLDLDITVGGATPVTFSYTNANQYTVQTSDINISAVGTGLQTVTVDVNNVVGTATITWGVGLLSISTIPLGASLPGVKDE